MQEIPALITDLTIILVVAALTTLLCKKINLPSVLGYILAGFLAGPVVQFLPTIEDLGSSRDMYPEAPENGIYIFDDDVEVGTDAVAALGLHDTVFE